MNFSRRDNFFRVVQITGPAHNLLGLELTGLPADAEIVEHPAPGPRRLDASEVKREVVAGVAEEAEALDLHVSVRRLEFVPSDSGPAATYRPLARALIRHFAEEIGRTVARRAA